MSEANEVDEPIIIDKETWPLFFPALEVNTQEKNFLILAFCVCIADMSALQSIQGKKPEPERGNIMNTQQDQVPQNTEELKEIPKWTRKYAQNRTLTTFVLIVITGLISMVIAALSALVWMAFARGNMILASVSTVVLAAVLIFLVIFVAKFGGKNRGLIDQRIDQWIYGNEGTTSMPEPKLTKKKKCLDLVVGVVVFISILVTMYLGMEGYLAFKYMQPVSAVYLVPFLVHVYFLQRPRIGPLVLVCPTLYAIHAILIVAGVPIFFTGNFCMLNLFLPFFGYTFLAYVIAHVYSRYALKKLKGLTHLEGDTANGD